LGIDRTRDSRSPNESDWKEKQNSERGIESGRYLFRENETYNARGRFESKES
jgi:hypothetical protein